MCNGLYAIFLFCVRGGMENEGYVFKLTKFIYLFVYKKK